MRRVVILGPGASGKSTLAIQLSNIAGLPVIELDKVFWQQGLTVTPRDQWINIQEQLVEGNEWIIDGDLGPYDAVEVRLKPAIRSFSWTSRPSDMRGELSGDRENVPISGCWLLPYRRRSRPLLMKAINRFAEHATLHVIRNPEALRRFVAAIGRNREGAESSA